MWLRELALLEKQSSVEAALESNPLHWIPLLFAFTLMGSTGAVTHWTTTTVV